jgi:FkbM family methyltransferase
MSIFFSKIIIHAKLPSLLRVKKGKKQIGELLSYFSLHRINFYSSRKLTFENFTIFHNNEEATRQTLEEIFIDTPYQFKSDKECPVVIDGGSNIGIATLFFKRCYPKSKILCFEPDPNAFKLLELNVKVNQLKDVTLINAALFNQEGKVNFYGQVYQTNPDTRGNSIIKVWGAQRTIYDELPVASVKLSSYVQSTVDFLKLDIEGAEELVLTELGDKLEYVKALTIEYHKARNMEKINDLDRISCLLNKYGFNYRIISNDISVLPDAVKKWSEEVKPALFTIRATKP